MATPGAAPPEGLPTDNRVNEILITAVVLVVFSTIFVVLRLAVSVKNKRYNLLTDYLLLAGAILNIAANIFAYRTGLDGQGRHVWDPAMTADKFKAYMKDLWWTQLLNIFSMALIKGSVCAYLFMLNFSKPFKIGIWISLVIHVSTNVIFPSVILFGECKPIAKHWDIMAPGNCWGDKPRLISGYMGSASNIITDLFYTSAPLVYLHGVQLPKRTVWGVRAVFLLALMTTVISALKLVEMKALNSSADPAYKAVNLSIYSMSEVAAGTFTACLPPLRKTFEKFLKQVLPDSFLASSRKQSSYALPAYGSQLSRTERTKPPHESDDESETAILPGERSTDKESKTGGITRTTHVSVSPAEPVNPKGDQWI